MIKPIADHLRSIDVRQWKKQGLLDPANHYRVSARDLRVRSLGDTLEVQLGETHRTIDLDFTATHFAGKRPWFLCPICGTRSAILYVTRTELKCRGCCGAGYLTQLEHPTNRALSRARKVRKRLGWSTNFLDGPGNKPRGMHWRTFERLVAEHDQAHKEYWQRILDRFG